MNTRNVNLDLIKCLACFCVVGLHAIGMTDYTIYYFCGCGVPLFFMVNGYLMLSKEDITYSYIGRKIWQLVKIVFLWNLLIAIPVLMFRHKFVNPFVLSFKSLLQKGYLWHFWFFGAMLVVYLILPPLYRFVKKGLPYHILTVFILFTLCIMDTLLSIYRRTPLMASIPQSLRLWIWLFYFMSGGLIFSLLPWIKKIPLYVHIPLTILSAVLDDFADKHIGLYIYQNRLAEYFYDELTSILFYLSLFTLLLRITINPNIEKIIISCSGLTMGIFIVHPILLAGIQTFCPAIAKPEVYAFWIILTTISGFIVYISSKLPWIRELFRLR